MLCRPLSTTLVVWSDFKQSIIKSLSRQIKQAWDTHNIIKVIIKSWLMGVGLWILETSQVFYVTLVTYFTSGELTGFKIIH